MTEKKDHATSLLILTGEESALIRKVLEEVECCGDNRGIQAFNRGMTRGTERLAAEFAEKQKAKRE